MKSIPLERAWELSILLCPHKISELGTVAHFSQSDMGCSGWWQPLLFSARILQHAASTLGMPWVFSSSSILDLCGVKPPIAHLTIPWTLRGTHLEPSFYNAKMTGHWKHGVLQLLSHGWPWLGAGGKESLHLLGNTHPGPRAQSPERCFHLLSCCAGGGRMCGTVLSCHRLLLFSLRFSFFIYYMPLGPFIDTLIFLWFSPLMVISLGDSFVELFTLPFWSHTLQCSISKSPFCLYNPNLVLIYFLHLGTLASIVLKLCHKISR